MSKVTVYVISCGRPNVVEKNRKKKRKCQRSFDWSKFQQRNLRYRKPGRKKGHVYWVKKQDIVFRSVRLSRSYRLTLARSLFNSVDFVGTVWVHTVEEAIGNQATVGQRAASSAIISFSIHLAAIRILPYNTRWPLWGITRTRLSINRCYSEEFQWHCMGLTVRWSPRIPRPWVIPNSNWREPG